MRTASPARRLYRCADGAMLAVDCRGEAHWRALAKCVGRPELAYEGDWVAASTAPYNGRLGHVLESLFREDAAETWLRRLEAHGVPARLRRPASRESAMTPEPVVFLITGIPGAGKTTVARALAARFDRGVHIEADVLQRMIVSGGEWPKPPGPSGEAGRQLRLRYRNAALLARSFCEAGFTAVIDDVAIGERLEDYRADLAGLRSYLVVLGPRADVVAQRDAGRDKNVFGTWSYLDGVLRETMQGMGLWLDTSDLTVEETVDEILRRVPAEGRFT